VAGLTIVQDRSLERMNRSEVDDNANNRCSHGYHVGALGYAGPGGWYNSRGDRVLICKVNPADVVSVPNDHSFQKLRCCYYEPVGEFQDRLQDVVYSGEVGGDYSSSNIGKKFESECVYDAHSLLEDNYYIGLYTKRNGITTRRFFLVEEVNYTHDTYTVCLVEPEDNAGDFRTFSADSLNEVSTWDGETDPNELVDPWVASEDEECEYCGEYECDGYCDEDDEEADGGCDYTGASYLLVN